MSYTPITPGAINWDVPLNAALVDIDARTTTNTNTVATKFASAGGTITGDVEITTNLTVDTNATIGGYFVANAGQSNGQWNIFGGLKDTLNLGTAGGGIAIKAGANARIGVSTLVGGTVTVANTSTSANTRIFLSRETTGGTTGNLSSTRINGTSFTINSSSGTDTSTVAWHLIEQT